MQKVAASQCKKTWEKPIYFLSRVKVFMQAATKMLLDVNTPPTQLLCICRHLSCPAVSPRGRLTRSAVPTGIYSKPTNVDSNGELISLTDSSLCHLFPWVFAPFTLTRLQTHDVGRETRGVLLLDISVRLNSQCMRFIMTNSLQSLHSSLLCQKKNSLINCTLASTLTFFQQTTQNAT